MLLLLLLLCLLVLGNYLCPRTGLSSSFHLESTICMSFQNFKSFADSRTDGTFKIIEITQHVIFKFLIGLNHAISDSINNKTSFILLLKHIGIGKDTDYI